MNGPRWLPHWELRTTNSLVKQEALSCPGASGVRRREEGRELAMSQGARQPPARARSDIGRIRLGLYAASSGTVATFFAFSAIGVIPDSPRQDNDEPVPGDRPCLSPSVSLLLGVNQTACSPLTGS